MGLKCENEHRPCNQTEKKSEEKFKLTCPTHLKILAQKNEKMT